MNLTIVILLDLGISLLFGIGFFIGAREVKQLRQYYLFSFIMFFGVFIFAMEILDGLRSSLFSRLTLLAVYAIAGVLFLYAYGIIRNKQLVIKRMTIMVSVLLISGVLSHFISKGSIKPFYLLNTISLGFYSGALSLCLIKSLKSFYKIRSYLILYRAMLLVPFLIIIYTGFVININLFTGMRLPVDFSVLFFAHIFVVVALGINFTLEGATSIITQLKKDSSTDALTGIPNRRYFNIHVEERRSENREFPSNQFVALLDLDHFKSINDSYGHDAGDMVLKEISRNLTLIKQKDDLLARYGGEEFALFFQASDDEIAFKHIDRLRTRIESMKLIWEKQEISVTLSIGYTLIKDKFESLETALKRADNALYSAKANGRNCSAQS